MTTGKVFAIEEFSVHDGPGMRMTVFLKGCPLRCDWCHNPEGQSFESEIVKRPQGCTGCGKCYIAGEGRLTEQSIAACPNGLLRRCGDDFTPHELALAITKKNVFFSDGGGVTFSGGEPLSQPDFLFECLNLLGGKVHRAVQTCGYAPTETFERILAHTDYVLYDLKLSGAQKSVEYTGKSNDAILQNFAVLAKSGVPFVVRIPVIPSVTDTAENLGGIADIMRAHGAYYAELMPYHKLSGSKYAMAGREYRPKFDESMPLNFRRELFAERGIRVKVLQKGEYDDR